MTPFVKNQSGANEPTVRSAEQTLMVEIITQAKHWSKLGDVDATIQCAVGCVANRPELKMAVAQSASVVLSDDDSVRQLNKMHRGLNKPTNVLSFPNASGPQHSEPGEPPYLGDVVLGYETVVKEARDQNLATSDHLSHLVIHGLLHLFGYDHETDEDARQMEQLEISALAELGIANPYQDGFQGYKSK